ncbi:hypothetical protein C8R43DRAFT_1142699 [Mycena crocata]|nr:hypothetical protein C8R43DRAFT_1142699 [Mycena crocata]
MPIYPLDADLLVVPFRKFFSALINCAEPCVFREEFVSLEAEEASGDEDDEDDEGYEESFIDDDEDEDEHGTPTPPPTSNGTPGGSKPNRGSTPPLTTRSKSKGSQAVSDHSDETLDNPRTPSSARTMLNTKGHSRSKSSASKGVKSNSVQRPAGDHLEQTELGTFDKASGTYTVSGEEFAAFLEHNAKEKAKKANGRNSNKSKTKQVTIASPPVQDNEIQQSKQVGRRTGAKHTGRNNKNGSVVNDGDEAPENVAAVFASLSRESKASKDAKGKGKAKSSGNQRGASKASNTNHKVVAASSSTSKRRRSSDSGDELAFPKDIETAFNAKSATPSPLKKAKTTSAASGSSKKVLHTENIKTVTKLPAKCAVSDKALQDPMLYDVYKNAPNLSKGTFHTWSPLQGPGNFRFSQWPEHCPNIQFRMLWACVNFIQHLQYVNLSRASPVGLQAISQEYGNNKRFTLSWDGHTATCMSTGMVVNSRLLTPGTVTAPTSTTLWQKFISIILHAQDVERLAGALRMIMGHQSLHAQIHGDAFIFATKSFSKDSFPIYDARGDAAFNISKDIDDVDNILPRFEDNESEIPNGSCATVGYTVSHFKAKDGKEKVFFNVRFLIVIATPDGNGSANESVDDAGENDEEKEGDDD